MARSIASQLNGLVSKIEEITIDVLVIYARKIMAEIPGSIAPFYRLEVVNGNVRIWTDNVFAAYIEFGTGVYAAAYLSGKPSEMTEDAIKFYVNGKGTIQEEPYLFPAYYRFKDEIVIEIDKRVQKYLDNIR